MNVIVEPTGYLALLARITGEKDTAVVRDNLACTWNLWYDVDYWANTVARPFIDLEEEILAPEVIILQANIEWFLARRPLAVLWTPGSTIII